MAFDRSILRQPPWHVYQNPNIEWMRIPPLPQQIIMTDRADGTLWLLSHNLTDDPPTDGDGRISINSTFSTGFGDYEIFGPTEGPVLPSIYGDVVLLVRGGRLGYEVRDVGHASDSNLRILTRKSTVRQSREINIPSGWNGPPDLLGWSPVEI